jgi:phosphoribosylamine---glycine ligase
MKILLIGSGGREHALAWKLAQSPMCDTLFVAPGNPGIARHATLIALDARDHAAVVMFCADHAIDLVVIGPEAPLVDGLADSLAVAGVACFGPTAKAAQLEGSKGFTKDLCSAANIPTAAYDRYASKPAAIAGLDGFTPPFVIKADGLAAGKGVIIAETRAAAEAAIDDMFDGSFGGAGASVVIEDFMAGEEVSFFALSDGKTVIPFASAQDHKRVGEGETGPNTGGMGAYSPATVLTPSLERRVMAEIIEPTIAAMAQRHMPFTGVLFAGLMLTAAGPKLIEYNARFGDPETQAILMRFEGDLAALLFAAATGTLAACPALAFRDQTAVCVVVAARGYPMAPERGGSISGLDAAAANGALVFQAGTRSDGDLLLADGGRVLAVTALGATLANACTTAYQAIDRIDYDGGFCRHDIGWRQLARDTGAIVSILD